jgi:hypothetical protein
MKIVQPKLSERKSQRSRLFATPTNPQYQVILKLKITEGNKQKRQSRIDPAFT